jgi:hypothetical protein
MQLKIAELLPTAVLVARSKFLTRRGFSLSYQIKLSPDKREIPRSYQAQHPATTEKHVAVTSAGSLRKT